MDADRNSQAMISQRLAVSVENLRHIQVVGDREYYRLIEAFRRDLFALFKDTSSVIRTVMASINEQYDMYEGYIPPSHHMFEINVLLTFKLDQFDDKTILEVYEHIFPRLDCIKDTYHLLCFLDKVFRKFTLKEKESEILRKLQSLICSSDKRSVRLVNSIIEHILKNWDSVDEQKYRFEELIGLPKWSKLEFYICKAFYETYVISETLFQIVLERIFQGFQENYTAYAAHILFVKAVSSSDDIFYSVIEDYVTCLLEKNIEQRTLHSSLITYVIPTISDYARSKFIQRNYSFKPIYKVHTTKYYYYKNYISNIDVELLNVIRRKNSKDKAIVKLIWELCCSFPRSDHCITKQHLALFMKCVKYHCDGSDNFLQNQVHSFLSQIIKLKITDDRLMYQEFFNQLAKLVKRFIDNFLKMRKTHAKATVLMSRSYLSLKTRFRIPYQEEQNPLYERQITQEWNIIKFYIRSGFGSDVLHGLSKPYYIGYDASFIQAVRKSLMVALTNPNLDILEHVRTYMKILLKMYKDHCNTLELDNLLSDITDMLLLQLRNIKHSQCNLIYLANPIYTSGEALHIIAEEYPEYDLIFVFDTADQIIRDTLALVDAITDVYTRKFIEQIFITHIQLLKTCTKRLYYGKPRVDQFLYLCEQVMCKTKFRKATSVAYNASLSVILSCRPQPLYKEIVSHLVERLDVHLAELEQVALNRCSGNKEMLLLTFKCLGNEPSKFATYFERMLNVSQGHQELHLVALEAICSDAELKELTAPYLVPVFKKTISMISHRNFRSRNAATQLIQVLANRFMGTKSELGHRPLCVLQAFERHPELVQICFDALCGSNDSSQFGVLTFIGDSPYHTTIFGESHEFPRGKIKELMNIKGIKMLATKALAMTVHSQYLYSTLSDTIQELQSGKFIPCNLLFTEYLLVRFINSESDKSLIQEIITKFEKFLNSPNVMASADAKKYLRYRNCEGCKLDLHYKYMKNDVEQILCIIRKCLFVDNFVALSFICFYIELTFHSLEDGNKEKLFQQLSNIFGKFNGGSSLTIHQYYSSIKNLLVNVHKDITIDVSSYNICHIFIAEIITFILRKKCVLLEHEKKVIKYLKDNLTILIKRCDSANEKQSSSVISTLTNLLYLLPNVGLQKLDFYYLFFIALLHILDKSKFCKIFKIITSKNYSISHYVQCLPKIIKQDLSSDYGVFIKSAAKHVSCNLNHFFIEYPCLYNCPEEFINVKIDIFLLQMVLKDMSCVL